MEIRTTLHQSYYPILNFVTTDTKYKPSKPSKSKSPPGHEIQPIKQIYNLHNNLGKTTGGEIDIYA